ncbi:collagen alpha-1(I) chain-like [Poecile atricapillus]|uniref:collagen alpha-1(I) chain-like n=1 Tax=Poecile atricapillus TaxID=48891 RepID=UPI002738C3BA|nr:collagen alpha-1(I) chain-like [Poecile atricapillus]
MERADQHQLVCSSSGQGQGGGSDPELGSGDPPVQRGLKGGGESGSFLSLSPGPQSPAAGRGARSPPGRAPRWRPGGAGGNGAGRGGAEESGGTETGPGGQGTAVLGTRRAPAAPAPRRLRYLWAAPHPGSSAALYPRAAPVLLAGSGAPGGSGSIGRLRCPVAAAHPGGSGVPAPGRRKGGSGRSQASGRGRPGRSSAPRVPGPPPAPSPPRAAGHPGGIRWRVNPGRAGGIYSPRAESRPDPGFAQNKGACREIPYTFPWASPDVLQAPVLPGVHHGSTSPGCPITVPSPGGLH